MPSLQSLRRKIASVKNTQKITKAMKMVSAAKLKRAQDRILAARPYAHQLREVMGHLSERVNRASHPLLQRRDGNAMELLVVTSDRGLCGAFNTNILRQAVEFLEEQTRQGKHVSVSLAGRKSIDFFRRRNWKIRQQWGGVFDRLSFEHALDIGQDIISQYQEGTFDHLYVVYNEFKSVMQQQVIIEKLLPIESVQEPGGREKPVAAGSYLYEPDENELLATLLPKHFEIQTYRVLLESAAAEQAARMTAMDGATRNAGELIKKVTLFYNKTRQAAITKELMDIVGGAEALK
ncbi:ATP synthase F1 subunit gamma [Candidatus Nitrospira allomarina]|jgi:F-type H+-transporting ATPase subunit gamma|uniref:ATP synthase gamma chain n=1 Tax=Candidatus Nitrospira allomarina TaxID=3020900 RepID=A0AA96JZT5_9BACT|nr:ATP synthase F1 subunit gamma [Candidatus Nitrospira allomarina]WNM58994.1 ATP synthase F1 subunit gamma [Candidatus Nitrospira allomarina]